MIMKRNLLLFVVCIFLLFSISVNAEDVYLASTPDSLFIQAAAGSIYFSDMVQPARDALIEMDSLAVPALVSRLGTERPRHYHALRYILPKIGKSAVQPLIEVLDDDSLRVVRLATEILGRIGDSTAVDPLRNLLEHENAGVRGEVYTALGRIGDNRCTPDLVQGLKEEKAAIRKSAAYGLLKMADSTSVPALVNALSDPYYGVRYLASDALVKIGEKSVPELIGNLDVENPIARYYTVETLGKLEAISAITPLLELLDDADPKIRAFAVEALHQIGSEDESLKTVILEEMATEDDPFVVSKLKKVKNKIE